MTKLAHLFLPRAVSIFLILIAALTCASAQTKYVIANDDVPFPFLTGVSFFSVGASGALTLKQQVLTGGHGGAAGYFGANRIAVLNASDQHCVYAPETYNGDIAGIDVDTLLLTSNTAGSSTDAGTSNGIGLALSTDYLYASFTDSNTIGTFKIESGCSLMFVNDTAVTGSQGGFINAMAVHGNMMVVTYTDGSIESFWHRSCPPCGPMMSHDERAARPRVASWIEIADTPLWLSFDMYDKRSTYWASMCCKVCVARLTYSAIRRCSRPDRPRTRTRCGARSRR